MHIGRGRMRHQGGKSDDEAIYCLVVLFLRFLSASSKRSIL